MKSIKLLLMAIVILLSTVASEAQKIKNSKTETAKIYGNCSMCKATIEEAGNLKKVANVTWDKETKLATITYNAKKTSKDEVLKRIALAGYDSEEYLAPDATYQSLEGCCQYERKAVSALSASNKMDMGEHAQSKMEMTSKDHSKMKTESHDHSKMESKDHSKSEMVNSDGSKMNMESHDHSKMESSEMAESQLKAVYDNYFELKNALVQTDGNTAAVKAKNLLMALGKVKMGSLSTEEHNVWMKTKSDLISQTEQIAETKDIKKQRDAFSLLSNKMYELIKTSKQETPTYYQFCPMANKGKGANWLSKESEVKNPYYGSMMMSCGKVVETIK